MGRIVALIMVLLLGLAHGTASLASEGGGGVAEYLPLESVLVNLNGKRRYLRADIQLLIDNQEHAERIKGYMPAIRDALIMLFSNRDPEQVAAVEQREKLRHSAMAAVVQTLEKYRARQGLEDLFFTEFLVQ